MLAFACDVINAVMNSKSGQFQKQLARIEELINALNAAPDSLVCMQARELVQALLEFHGAGFEQALTLIHDTPAGGQALIDRCACLFAFRFNGAALT
jgi:hypothetical protein